MRAGGCAVQQTLTAEAASVLKHSLSLARRRGHAQVTPLHVAFTLLSSRASLLRRACLKSQPHQSSHPLQCRALELCFNVALNRLPTTPAPILHGQPSLSNALVAALKRAQAHQRRGCIEQQQQQPLLTIKVELEQLIISILDDPSVSRVMREAGFSSTAVKNNVEDSSSSSPVFQCYGSSGGVFSSPSSPTRQRDIVNSNPTPTATTFWQSHFLTYSSEQNPLLFSPLKKVSNSYVTHDSLGSVKEDIKLVLEVMLRKKRKNTVIISDSVSMNESLVVELMDRFERGEVPEELKSTHFIKFQFAPVALRFMKREDVEMNLVDLKRKVDSLATGGTGAIIYTGDLKWTVEATAGEEAIGFNPVEYLVAEIGRLVADHVSNSTNSKVWLIATASYQTYMKCQMRQPSLELQWGLQAVPVPSGGLDLSLQSASAHDSRTDSFQKASQVAEPRPPVGKDLQDKLSCCVECVSNYEKEAQLLTSGNQKVMSSWFQPQDSESPLKNEMMELRRKWNRFCHSLHQGRQNRPYLASSMCNKSSHFSRSFSFNTSHPWSSQNSIFPESNSFSFTDSGSATKPYQNASMLPHFKRQQSCTIEFNLGSGAQSYESRVPNLDACKENEYKDVRITLGLGTSLFSDSGKAGRAIDRVKIGRTLRENVPWQSETIPSIVEALIASKSTEKGTWLLVEGNDTIGKRRLAHAIAWSVFGSADMLLHLNMRKCDGEVTPCSELAKAFESHEKLVILVEEVDMADTQFKKYLNNGFEAGYFEETSKGEGKMGQQIFILTRGNSNISEDRMKDQIPVAQMGLKINETAAPGLEMSLFDHKRKAEWNLSDKAKSPRIEEKEAAGWDIDKGASRKDFSRQSSFNTLDLNLEANEDDETKDKPGELSPISSDLTREINTDVQCSQSFLESIASKYVFNRNATRDREMEEFFLSKMKKCFEEVCGAPKGLSFDVEEKVLEEVCIGSGFFLNSLFEKWLKDIFRSSLQKVKFGGKDGIRIRLCLENKDGGAVKEMEDGFMGSTLPKEIHVHSME